MKEIVFDVEADDLHASKIHCLSYQILEPNPKGLTSTAEESGNTLSTEATRTLVKYDQMREFFQQDAIFIGHNIRRWDIPTLERILGIEIRGPFVDTLAVAWYLEPQRKKNGLEVYGEEFGIEKPKISDWNSESLFVYVNRCEQDVRINFELWKKQKSHLLEIYEDPNELFSFLKYLDFKLYCAHLAEKSGWKLDKERCLNAVEDLEAERERKLQSLKSSMPKVEVVRTYVRPKRYRNADGELSVLGRRWEDRLRRAGLPSGYEGDVEEVVGFDDPNPGSTEQVKAWLYSLGWVPRTIKQVRDKKTGDTREIPQIYKEHGHGEVCDSVRDLFDTEPALSDLDSLGVLTHRIGLLRGFLRDVSPDGYLRAKVAGLTNTLRFKHAEIVNLPKPEVPYGSVIRGCLVADDESELLGADMSGLEDRLKQHFLYKHDPDYVADLQSDDYDPHLDIGVLAGGITKQEAEFYKRFKDGDDLTRYKSIKSKRSVFKNGNYGAQYGAGIPRLMVTCGIDRAAAANLHKTYWERNWAIKAVAEEQEIKVIRGQSWLRNPISGFWYSLRFEKDIFSTLVQGSASYCFDTWVSFILDERPQITGQFHDEVVLSVRKGYRDEIESFLRSTINQTNELLGLNVSLDIGIQFGDRYSEIH